MTAVPEAHPKTKPLLQRPAVMRLLILALLAEVGYAVLNISTMPVYLQFDRGFGASVTGLVVTAFLLSEAVFKSPMGALADRVGRKTMVVLGPSLTIFTALATLVVPFDWGTSEVLALIGLRLVDGLGAAMLWPAMFALMSDSVEDHERQQAMSLLNMCYLLGVALALPVGGIVNDLFGRFVADFSGARSPSLYLAALLFAGVSLTAYWKIVSDREHHKALDVEGGSGVRELWLAARGIPEYLLLAVVTFMGIGFPMTIIKVFAEEQFRMSESKFGALSFPAVVAMAVLSVPMAKIGERMGRARAVHYGLGLCSLGLTLVALGAFIPGFRVPWPFAVGGLFVGFGFLLAIPSWMASVSDIDPRKRGVHLGAIMTAQGVGAILGAPLGAAAYEKLQPLGRMLGLGVDFGRYSPFVGCAVCVAIGWAISVRILRDPAS